MIKNIIKNRLVTIAADANVTHAAQKMADENVGCLVVLEDNGKPRGLLTDRDIVIRCIAKNIDVDDCTVENILSESPVCVSEDDGLYDCIKTMHDAKVRRVPVVNDAGKAVGVISFGDVLSVLGQEFADLVETTTPMGEERRAAA